ncbi:MAG TPA: T9SS type A sorting domain-containing protein [Bacteroidia bacterium]|jgi:polyhydroxybutyrate depolymerase|nr:T9SS type A sorting domain-containing protein [Bacteroidia bacterium]
MLRPYAFRSLLAAFGLLLSGALFAQTTVIDSFMYGGVYRNYRLYIPAIYQPTKAVPLVFNLHGLGSNAAQQEYYGDFRPIADTADFILAHPNGTKGPSGQGWNNFGTPGTGVDDIGFISALIDTISKKYSIDHNRVFSTGMSNGGFMSYELACFLSNRIAAIASVSGSMIASHYNACNAQHPTPVMEIHGTTDPVVSYPGNGGIVASIHIDTLVHHWVVYDHASLTPVITQLPDINMTDGCTVEHQVYSNGRQGSSVELYKVINGGHDWPGAPINAGNGNTNRDFSASKEIWRFFSQYHLNILTGISETKEEVASWTLFPNPAKDGFEIRISSPGNTNWILHVYDALGQEIRNQKLIDENNYISRNGLPAGMYTVRISNGSESQVKKVVFY